ncbi:MAG: AraC family transcriptional regulator ligand-binding domain-containing protein [Pseudoalteromonas prydzensis]|uniref:AraC family transcriptional regulator n=1 Tax=Pseudoalteromonas prydzensis TaxID=182141 RepID=UPI003704AAC1
MYYVSSQIIRALVQFLIAQGIAPASLDALLATRVRYLNESRYRFPIEDYEQLMRYAEKSLHCDHIGLKFGQSLKTQSWGLLGHIALVSDSLAKVLLHAQKLNTTVRNIGTISLRSDNSLSYLTWQPSIKIAHHMVDELFSSWLSFAKHCCYNTTELALEKVQLTRAEPNPTSLRAYKTVFNCPIEFSASHNCLCFKSSLLTSPLHSANKEIEYLLAAQASTLVSEQDEINQLKAFITAHLPQVPSIEQAACHLGFKKRSLQRYLRSQNCSYSQLIDELRKYHAKLMLQQKVTLLEITNRLGFCEQSAFQRAFKRWYGCPPKKFLALKAFKQQ